MLRVLPALIGVGLLGLAACDTVSTALEESNAGKPYDPMEVRRDLARAAQACERSMQTGEDLTDLQQYGFEPVQQGSSGNSKQELKYKNPNGSTNSRLAAFRGSDTCEVTLSAVPLLKFQEMGQVVIDAVSTSEPRITHQQSVMKVVFEE